MAIVTAPAADPAENDTTKAVKSGMEALEIEALERLADARYQKVQFEMDLREGYFFAAPHRTRTVFSTTKPSTAKPRDADLLSMSFAFELCGDFPTVMTNTFFPKEAPWCVRRAGPMVPDEQVADVEKLALTQDGKVFKSIIASNFYAECGKAFNPDLALGTVALWIDHQNKYAPPKVQAIPLREIEINLGPDGQIDDRFVVRYTKHRHLKKVLPGIVVPARIIKKAEKKKRNDFVVVWGFWRIYDDTHDEKWQHVVLVDDQIVHSSELKGAGSCPLVIARFNATPEWAWGVGPLIQSLPDLRMMDELTAKKIKNVDMLLAPPISFPDDSFANISEGIETGYAYPVRPGTEGAIKNIYDPPRPDPAIYFTQDMEQRMKRLFFLDWPQQRGDTPPTATQWLDEMTLAQRRIGTPGETFWSEFCGGVFMRFIFMLQKAGQIKPVTMQVSGSAQSVSLMPYNPAQRSAEQEEVALFSRFAQIGTQAFPEEWKLVTDGKQTLENIANKMGVNNIWAQRSKADVQGAMEQIKGLMGGNAAGAPAIPGVPEQPQDIAGPAPNQPKFTFRGSGM
jgi:hypothetical protein